MANTKDWADEQEEEIIFRSNELMAEAWARDGCQGQRPVTLIRKGLIAEALRDARQAGAGGGAEE